MRNNKKLITITIASGDETWDVDVELKRGASEDDQEEVLREIISGIQLRLLDNDKVRDVHVGR